MLSSSSAPKISGLESYSSQTSDTIPVRILVVDDRPENLLAMRAAFRDMPYEVMTCLSGHEALALVQQHECAAILLDVQMPEIDGFETARRIRRIPGAESTPILFVTAIHRTYEHEQRAYVEGAVDYLFKPVDTNVLLGKVAVFADLYRKTQQIRMQAEVIKQQALKEQELELLRRAVQARDEFISVASHELNTPITPLSLQLQSFIRIIENGTFESVDPARIKRMLSTAYSQVERLSRIIRELVDVSRLSGGRLELVEEEVSLEDVARDVIDSFQEELLHRGCEVSISAEVGVRTKSDRNRIEQVFVNLVSNAIKYGQGHPIVISIYSKGDRACLEVKDHGIGIAFEDQERIFERFERAVPASNYGGLGLGLYIVKEILNLHGGTVHVQSELGAGATFIVELPLA